MRRMTIQERAPTAQAGSVRAYTRCRNIKLNADIKSIYCNLLAVFAAVSTHHSALGLRGVLWPVFHSNTFEISIYVPELGKRIS
jgi:hypothetical protein